MNFRRLLLPALIIFVAGNAVAQKETANWCFGTNIGLTFSPEGHHTFFSSVNTLEGASSISDKNGNLLFYTDGKIVFDRYHQIMPNGTQLYGRESSTQSSVIVPKPGDSTVYYIFTADAISTVLGYYGELGYNYSIVDLKENNGLGAVVAKNIHLYAPSTEKLTVTKHKDGIRYWILTHEAGSNRFKAYLLDCNGVNDNPVISSVGYTIPRSNYPPSEIGQMKFSPNGKKLAMASAGSMRVSLFDFDNETGVVSNELPILDYYNYPGQAGIYLRFEYAYGVEFSPDNRLLYVSNIDGYELFQFDATKTSALELTLSVTIIYTSSVSPPNNIFGRPGALQLGPDNKIYLAFNESLHLRKIDKPNQQGLACDFSLGPQLSNVSKYGLPGFVTSFFNPTPEFVHSVNGCSIELHAQNVDESNIYQWTIVEESNNPLVLEGAVQHHEFEFPGTYKVKLNVTNSAGCSKESEMLVTASCMPELFIPNLITPNADGLNDVFQITGLEKLPDNSVTIYNRWGNRVFYKESYTAETGWDGSGCPDGIYFYELHVPDFDYKHKGFVQVVR